MVCAHVQHEVCHVRIKYNQSKQVRSILYLSVNNAALARLDTMVCTHAKCMSSMRCVGAIHVHVHIIY